MGIRGRRGWTRQRVRREASRGWFALCGLGLIVAGVTIFYYPSDARAHQLAIALGGRGTSVVANEVTVFTEEEARGRSYVNEVRVAFRLPQGGEVRADLSGVASEDSAADRGWGPPQPDSAYLAPLDVVYLPEDPTRAMTPPDVDAYRIDVLAQDRIAAAIGAAPAAGTALWWGLAGLGRRRGWGPTPTRGRHSRDV